MLAPANNRFRESLSPHSMSLANDMQIPNPGLDSMMNLGNDKLWSGPSPQTGLGRLGGLTFDGTGLLGTGLFSGDISTWGIPELLASVVGFYAVYAMFYQAKTTTYKAQGAVHRRRKTRATKLRARAKEIESLPLGSFRGLL